MTEKEELRAWLNSDRDFDRGLMLHIAYFNDTATRALLQRTRDAQRLFKMLLQRFKELPDDVTITNQPAAPEVTKEVKAPVKPNMPAPTGKTAAVAEGLKVHAPKQTLWPELLQQWESLKLEQENWHAKLRVYHDKPTMTEADQKQCAELSRLLIEKDHELKELANAMQHFKLYGKLPEEYSLVKPQKPVKVPVNLTEAEKVLYLKNSVNPNISKLRKKIREAEAAVNQLTGKQREKKLADIAGWVDKLTSLEAEKKQLEA